VGGGGREAERHARVKATRPHRYVYWRVHRGRAHVPMQAAWRRSRHWPGWPPARKNWFPRASCAGARHARAATMAHTLLEYHVICVAQRWVGHIVDGRQAAAGRRMGARSRTPTICQQGQGAPRDRQGAPLKGCAPERGPQRGTRTGAAAVGSCAAAVWGAWCLALHASCVQGAARTLSGWYSRDSLRYAFLISLSEAVWSRPRISKGSNGRCSWMLACTQNSMTTHRHHSRRRMTFSAGARSEAQAVCGCVRPTSERTGLAQSRALQHAGGWWAAPCG